MATRCNTQQSHGGSSARSGGIVEYDRSHTEAPEIDILKGGRKTAKARSIGSPSSLVHEAAPIATSSCEQLIEESVLGDLLMQP